MFTKRIFLSFYDRHCRSNTLLRSLNLRLGPSVISFILCYFSQFVKHCFATSEHACPFNSTNLARALRIDSATPLELYSPLALIIVRRLGFYVISRSVVKILIFVNWSECSLRNIRHEQLLHFNQTLEFHYLA